MVRLKEASSPVIYTERKVFQFHYGTIKSCCGIPEMVVYMDFNSIMVRLKAYLNAQQKSQFEMISIPLWYD